MENMSVVTSKEKRAKSQNTAEVAGRVAALLLVLAITTVIVLNWDRLESLAVYGYPAVFLVSLLGNATLFLPAPSAALVVLAGGFLDPLTVAIVAGLGAAIGELTTYVIGYSGQAVFEDKATYRRIRYWMSKSGPLVIFLLGAVPNPFFDIGGLIAGATRMPVWLFILASWLGKSIRFGVLAFAGLSLASL